ncbi:hypothetical protein [Falsiroseomonas sp. HW251]|uniref:hypothetical protein n=1 Tax=Falsiroseomonas sp. HW251 TaxID=3390998 RepID=UPI003D32304E
MPSDGMPAAAPVPSRTSRRWRPTRSASADGLQGAFASVLPRHHFALITNSAAPAQHRNAAIRLGQFRPPDLRAAPFGWPVDPVFAFGNARWRKSVVLRDRDHVARLVAPTAGN